MYQIEVTHKYTGMTRNISGESIAQAYKENGLLLNYWIVTNIYYEK